MAKDKQETDFDELIKDIKGNIKTRLSDLMSKLLNNAEETLFEMAENAPSNEEQTRHFELMRQLKNLKPEIAANFAVNITPYLRPYPQVEADKEKASIETEDELSLVDNREIEDMVLVKNIGEKAASKYRDQLSHLEARLEHLALKTDLIFPKDALKPIHFCEAFDDALGDEFDIPNKKILFDLFGAEVAGKLDSLYDSINNRLIDASILPQIKLYSKTQTPKRRRSDHSPTPPNEASPQDEAQQEGGFEPQSYGNYAMTAAPGASYGHRGAAPGASPGATANGDGAAPPAGGSPGLGEAPYSTGGGAPANATVQGGGGAGGGAGAAAGNMPDSSGDAGQPAAGGNYSHYTAGMPANHVSQVLGNFFGVPIAPAGEQGDVNDEQSFAAHTASTPQYYGHNEILTALSHVQATPQFTQPEELKFDGEAIKKALLEDIAKQSGGVVTKRINQIAEKTIDFIELIFDAIIDDEEISDTIKALLLRLQIPVIKASMADPEFFIYDDHPARVLLDKIADVGVGVTDHSDPVYVRLDKIVTRLINEFDLQTSTFQLALDDLDAFINELEEAARKQEEEVQRQVLREHARKIVLKALRSITAGKVLPEGVHPLVLKRWPTLMFNHYLEFGKENDEWIVILEILRDIVDSVQPIETAEDLAYLKTSQHELIDQIRHKLSRTNQSTRDIDNVIQGLTDTHASLIEHASFTEEQVEEAEEVIADEDMPRNVTPIQTEPAEPKPALPSNVMPGMWFHVYMGEDSPARRCKLSVIIMEDSNMVFVNHAGEIVVEKGFEEFEQELKNGQTTVIMGHSVFDHALNSVITRLAPAN